MGSKSKEFLGEIDDLILKEMDENSAILGISIGTETGQIISTNFKKEIKLSANEVVAASSSLMFLSSNISKQLLNQKVKYHTTVAKNEILINVLANNINVSVFLDRELAELEGIGLYQKKITDFAIKVSAFIETSEYIKKDIFVEIKRAIPTAISIAIITRSGLPVKIQSVMPDPMISAITSALFNLTDVLLKKTVVYSILTSEDGSIIVHQIDDNRILCVAIPDRREDQIGKYIARIKEIIKENK